MNESEAVELINLKNEVKNIKRQNKLILVFFFILTAAFLSHLFIVSGTRKISSLRVEQLIVEDSNGNDRIVISANISKTKSRTRQDSIGGVLILNELGKDQLLLGHSKTAQFNSKQITRIAGEIPYGLFINDSIGDERGGITYYNKRQLAVVGLDNSSGEGVHLLSSEKGLYGMLSGILVQQDGGSASLFAGEDAEKKLKLSLTSKKQKVDFYLDSASAAITTQNLKDGSLKTLFRSN